MYYFIDHFVEKGKSRSRQNLIEACADIRGKSAGLFLI